MVSYRRGSPATDDAPRRVTVRGITLAADVRGEGPAVLFVHGFPLDRTMWRQLAATLTGRRRIAPDLRGMGASDAPADGYDGMAAYADDLAALLDALHVPRAAVCGLSMGGYVAFELVRRHAERVSALILANTRAAPDTPEGRRAREETIALIERDGPAALADRMIQRMLAPASLRALPHVVQQLRATIASQRPEGLIGALRGMLQRADATPLLPALAMPVLVIAGSDDRIVPLEEARAMAVAIPGAQLAVIPDAGHLTPLEQPVATSRVVTEFLDAHA